MRINLFPTYINDANAVLDVADNVLVFHFEYHNSKQILQKNKITIQI